MGGEATYYNLPVLKFIEYMYITTDRVSYDDYANITTQDFTNYLMLKELPKHMLRTFDEDYFLNYYREIESSDNLTRFRDGDSRITSNDLTAFANVLAYQLANRFGYKDLLQPSEYRNEAPVIKKLGVDVFSLGPTILSLSKSSFIERSNLFGSVGVALLTKFLLRSYVINAETELRGEDTYIMDSYEITRILNLETTYSDLDKLFDKVSFAVNTPLLYTKLSDDILQKAGFSWKQFSELEPNDRNALYGALLEVYIRGGVSELEFICLPFTSGKLRYGNDEEIDIVSSRAEVLCEITVSNKKPGRVNLDNFYKDTQLIRVCSTKNIKGVYNSYYRIPYPLLCCMIDTGGYPKATEDFCRGHSSRQLKRGIRRYPQQHKGVSFLYNR